MHELGIVFHIIDEVKKVAKDTLDQLKSEKLNHLYYLSVYRKVIPV